MYAGHADLGWPRPPHLVMWHAVTLLREYRGDGHTAALGAAGLSGLEALVTHTATGRGFTPAFARASRGWDEQQWAAAESSLASRGLLDAAGALTPAGQDLRQRVEDETDAMAAAPWRYLGEERTEELVRIGRALTRAALAAGAMPAEGVFAGR